MDTPSVTDEMNGFISDFNVFAGEVKQRLEQQETRMTRLDRKSAYRPALSAAVDTDAPHQKAFDAYLRSGDDDGLRHIEIEGKAMSTAVAADGGYLVSPQTAQTIQSVLNATASIRAISSVVNVDASSYDVLVDRTEPGAGWASETGTVAESTTPVIDRISIRLHELSALPKVSQRLLDDSAFDLEDWLATRIAQRFARAEAAAFVNGDGVDKPNGFLTVTKVANASFSWGNLGYVATGSTAALPADSIVDLVYALGAEYRAGASFVMNSKTTGVLRKLKDSDGRFLWSDGLAAGEPARLMGYPVLIAEDMPDIAANAFPVAFGNFTAGYTIAERADLRVLRDPFSAKPHVLFYATKRVGGAVTDYAAIKLLRYATA
ncbi:phage major capsid protein [Ketogulonicigenium vulgare]|uniref:Phage phi-C31 gp36 major capsid-like protein n=1 Tax=Ketogulonicigenium vulgare (strain WSH-001) TaxID=759362 RepID=F9Y456_KETVW|nr:phage major capsid protein [Ketogulonicigenium vulgare]ADO42297.1 HK97 family major capsid protein [Ketogulonicigenium vulgare Y25]AEM40492.1 Phage phi-C31 gp36 major capsid-like protein [Ketogulonicigenium vulgare WSH-001]ALJ80677.1 capsid protein [Ketogulonicigenium vulgare]ANW33485.1 capsid protein [Ketogulonicigenium vulgare]AOZ54209.1 HK97 family major capsid protein [Ketogulonicigenium vulgare]